MKHTSWLSLPIATLGCLIPLSTQAQVTPDGTTSTTVNGDGNNFTIEQGDRVGDNLFHSFDDFSVPTLGSAVFNNAGDIANIFSRVTGSSISNIDGLLGANGTANLFLINPNGIIFGENSSLNLGGSFFASTADSLLFEGDTEFSAVNPQAPPLLEVSIPTGARFRDNPGDIVNRSFAQNDVGDFAGLEVETGKNLTLLGGNLIFESGNATARGGNIYLGGLTAAGIVEINSNGSLSFSENLSLANITLTNASDVDVRGAGGGNIGINARNLSLEAGNNINSFIRAGINNNSVFSEAQAGNITINATENIFLDDSRVSNRVDPEGVGNSGNINIATSSLQASNGARISATTEGQGNAGNITITAAKDITFEGEASNGNASGAISLVNQGAIGNAGNIIISTKNLNLTNGGTIVVSTESQGNAGSIDITATENINFSGETSRLLPSAVLSGITAEAEGNAGNITITTKNLNLLEGGLIDASTLGRANAGSIEIIAMDNIFIAGEDSRTSPSAISSQVFQEGDSKGIFISTFNLTLANRGLIDASTSGKGNAGSIIINANNISLNRGFIVSQVNNTAVGNAGGLQINTASLSLLNGGQILGNTFGEGNAGNLSVKSERIELNGGDNGALTGLFASVQQGATGKGGNIIVGDEQLPTQQLILDNGAQVVANTFGEGNAGNLSIFVNNININGAGDFPSGLFVEVGRNATGKGGNINIGSEQSLVEQLSLTNGAIIGGNSFGIGDSGNTSIVAEKLSLDSGAKISTGTRGIGNGGKIFVEAEFLSLNGGGRIASNVETGGQGDAGTVEILANDSIVIDGKAPEGFPSAITSVVDIGDGVGNAGNVSVTTNSLSLTNGGRVSATSLGQGNSGDLTINAAESIFISGFSERFRSGIVVDALVGRGDSGNAEIFTDRLTIQDGGTIEASNFDSLGVFSEGTGEPGNLSIKANSINLNNEGRIEAATQFAEGNSANIDLTVTEDIILQNNSFISARALKNARGGNVAINASDGFILAFPNQDNNIIANAAQGNGGEIDINTQAIFGLEERPLNSVTNDINASSQATGLDGTIDINNPAVDPTTGLINLPASVGDASDQISQNPCQQGVGSQFIVTGKGGLPPNPTETLDSDRITVDLVEPLLRQGDEETKEQAGKLGENTVTETVPAMGWIFNDKGEVTLTAYSNTDTERAQSQQYRTACQSNISP